MKRLRSSDDLDSYEKNASKEWSQDQNRSSRSSSSSGFYYKPSSVSENPRTKSNLISSSSPRYDRDQSVADDDSGRERVIWKRADHDFDSFDRRKKEFNRYRESGSSIRRSESFRGPRRDFLKGFRSERDRSRHESGSSWKRFGINENRGSSSTSSKLQPREVKDVKSPSWSRDSLVAGSAVSESREREKMRRRSSISMSRSPTRSKDSGSEQSKSVGGGGEVKRSEHKPVESETSSEMEEGELDPEPQTQPEDELATESGNKSDEKESCHKETENDGGETNSNAEVVEEVNEEVNKEMENERKDETKVNDETGGNGDRMDAVDGDQVEMQEGVKVDSKWEEDSSNDAIVYKPSSLEESCKEDKGIDHERQIVACEETEFIKEVAEENDELKTNIDVVEIGLTSNVKDKAKGIAVESTNVSDSTENGVWTERESKDEELDMEGPSTRGFELFSCSPVRRVETEEQSGIDKKEGKLEFESLDLSLSLPNVLLPIGAQHTEAVTGSPSHGRSVQ